MRRQGQASSAGSFEGSDKSRGRLGSLLTVLALAICALAVSAAPAAATPPIVTMGTVSNVLGASAHVTGTVDPVDQDTYAFFEYSTNPGVEEWSYGPECFARVYPAGSGPTEISETLGTACYGADLKPETTYYVRVVGFNLANENTFGAEPYAKFTTLPVASPVILTANDATGLTNSTAEFSGSVERPAGSDPALNVTCNVEYITAAAYRAAARRKGSPSGSTNGNYYLGWEGQSARRSPTTPPRPQVQAALETFVGIGPGSINVSGGPGSPSPAPPRT